MGSGEEELQWDALAAELALDFGAESSDEELHDARPQATPAPAPPASVERRSRGQLTHAEFHSEFRHRKPVLLSGFASGWMALSRWSSVEHLASLLGEDVLVLRSPDDRRFLKRDCEQEQRPFGDVVRELFVQPAATASERPPKEAVASRMYARSPLRAGLRAEVDLRDLQQLVGETDSDIRSSGPSGDAKGGTRRSVFKDENCGVWLGTAGNVTPLHYDLCHGFLVQVLGTKTVTYFEPDDYRYLYQRKEHPELSQVDLDAWRREQVSNRLQMAQQGVAAQAESIEPGGVDSTGGAASGSAHAKWPRFAEATPRTVTLMPGDCLYTPPFWWHHVATSEHTPALSVLVPFDMSPEEPVHPAHFM
ncbi:cupin-like domain-containing protein [bacterium]|nr:cupin-like domain-containing protein [bacterium]